MSLDHRWLRALSAACAVAAVGCARPDAPGMRQATAPSAPQIAARDADGSPRGALLYETHCSACHTTQVHWRERSLVSDWESLTHQVWRWQNNANLDWSASDIDEVARYLNRVYYKLPAPAGPPARGRG